MRKRISAASASLAALMLLSTLFVGTPAAHAQNDPASRAVRFLQSQQKPDGSVDEAPGETADAVLGTAATGVDPSTVKTAAGVGYYDYLSAQATAGMATMGPGLTGKIILAVLASPTGGPGHRDPATFPSGANSVLAHLQGLYNATTGAYGVAPSTFDQALAIIAMKAAAPLYNQSQAPVYLVSQRDSTGGWNYTGVANNVAVPSDSNSTAIALMALDGFGDHRYDGAPGTPNTALGFLKSTQASDGGFQYQAPFGSDPDSDALVLQALVAAGQSPYAPAWLSGGHDAYSNLLTFQDPASGGFAFSGAKPLVPDAFTSSQVPAGLELQPFPFVARFQTGTTTGTFTAKSVAALKYLAAQQAADGSVGGAAGPTEDWVLGVAATGYDPRTLRNCANGKTAFDYLGSQAPGALSAPAGPVAKLILAALAGGYDPTGFPAPGSNLLARLQSLYNASTGAYGTAPATFDQALAIIAMKAAAPSFDQSNAPVYLLSVQDSTGGWGYSGTHNDPLGSDSNSTAIALMALDAFGDHSHDGSPGAANTALGFLKSLQAADGGFQYQATGGSDPDSDALVLQALVAATQDPVSVAWSQGTSNVLTNIGSFQDASGGFTFPGGPGPDAFTTSQVPAGLERVPFPVPVRYGTGVQVPGTACPTPAPTPTPSPAPTSTPTPTPTSTPTPAPTPTATATPAPGAVPPPATPTPASAESPSPSPSPTPSASPSATPSLSPSPSVPASPTSVPRPSAPGGGGPNPWFIYILVGFGVLAIVGGGGTVLLYLLRRG